MYQARYSLHLRDLSATNAKVFTDYFFSTFMQHYLLFQYVFTNERDKMITHLDLVVQTPKDPLPFKESKEITVWEYEQKLKVIEEAGEKMKTDRKVKDSQDSEEAMAKMKDIEGKLQELEMPMSREVSTYIRHKMPIFSSLILLLPTLLCTPLQRLLELIDEIASKHITVVSIALQSSIEKMKDELSIMFEKTNVPRPAVLGKNSTCMLFCTVCNLKW